MQLTCRLTEIRIRSAFRLKVCRPIFACFAFRCVCWFSFCIKNHRGKMHLFSLGSRGESAVPLRLNSQETTLGDQAVTIRLASHCFSLPQAVTSKPLFQKSKLGIALNSVKFSKLNLPDETIITRVSPGELHIERSSHNGSDPVADFALLTDHLLERNPLETFGFSSVADAYQRLLDEVRFWGLHKLPVELPYRLWTRSRWTDLTGLYVLSKSDAELLKFHPVAIQRDDGTVQGVRVLKKVDLDNADATTIANINEMLNSEADFKRVVAFFEYLDCQIVLLNIDKNQTLKATDNGGPSCSSGDSDIQSPLISLSSTAASFSIESNTANQFLIKLPRANKIVAYDFSRSEYIKVPNGIDYPMFYRRGDRHVFCFNSTFTLEVQELVDAISGLSKIRCGQTRIGNEPKMTLSGPSTTTSPQTSVMSLFKAPSGTTDKKRETWQCYHPQLHAKYVSSMKWIKDFGEVRRIKLFPWGAILVLNKVDSPFAILSIDHSELKKIYGDRISICVRGFPHSVLNREDIDVTVTADLQRVYLCCCSQIASASIVPQNSRVDFEIAELPNKKYKLRLVHVDIPEGVPNGNSLGSLNCLGLYAEYDPKSGMFHNPIVFIKSRIFICSICFFSGIYYQNQICKQLCTRYLSAVPPIEPETQTSDIEYEEISDE